MFTSLADSVAFLPPSKTRWSVSSSNKEGRSLYFVLIFGSDPWSCCGVLCFFQLLLVGEDNKEEVNSKEPACKVQHKVEGSPAEGRLDHVAQIEAETDTVEN